MKVNDKRVKNTTTFEIVERGKFFVGKVNFGCGRGFVKLVTVCVIRSILRMVCWFTLQIPTLLKNSIQN